MCPHVLSLLHAAPSPDPEEKKTATSGKPVTSSSPLLSLFWHHCGPSRLLLVQLFVFTSTHVPSLQSEVLLVTPPSHEKFRCMPLTVTLLHISFKDRFVPRLVLFSVRSEVFQRAPADQDLFVHFEDFFFLRSQYEEHYHR